MISSYIAAIRNDTTSLLREIKDDRDMITLSLARSYKNQLTEIIHWLESCVNLLDPIPKKVQLDE